MVTAIVTIVIFLVLISFHEFGHFIVSKAIGVPVLEFAIGMGPAIFKKQGKETLYSVRILPIGGYCRLEGEDEQTDNPRAFQNQKLWKRFLVMAAGAVVNLLLGFLIFVIMFAGEDSFYTTEIASIDTRSYLAETAVEPGDKLIAINGKKVHFYSDISLYTQDIKVDDKVTLTVKGDAGKKEVIIPLSAVEETYFYQATGVQITSVMNGKTEESFLPYAEGEREMFADRIGKQYQGKGMRFGFSPVEEQANVINRITQAYHATGFTIRLVYDALWDLIRGAGNIDDLSGPVGIVSVVNAAVESESENALQVLNIMAMLTINLGIFNLLPLPALDGGRLFFLLVELIRRKPIPPEKEGMIHAIGLLLFFAFAIFISYNDIMKLLGR